MHLSVGKQSTEIEPAGEESTAAKGVLVQALQARITALEREIRDSDNTHRLRRAYLSYSLFGQVLLPFFRFFQINFAMISKLLSHLCSQARYCTVAVQSTPVYVLQDRSVCHHLIICRLG